MEKEVIGTCPICQGNLIATKLSCPSCQIEITGAFKLSSFSNLTKEELDFVAGFISVYGNIKEMEKMFNISYPTVKKNLDLIISKMGLQQHAANQTSQTDILDKLANKELSVKEALDQLKGK
ncbi:MAG: DUF2089 domain-containing protein [Erysipelothrix sp.]|nr:DUF2089 domain-containing protein [Erysipelothrix sp.]